MPTQPKAPKKAKRAYEPDGKFMADDPATPDVNEAFVEQPQAEVSTESDLPPVAEPPEEAQAADEAAPAGSAQTYVIFESREKEQSSFNVHEIKPRRNFSNGRLEWEVPTEIAHLFGKHFHCQSGRIVRKAGE